MLQNAKPKNLCIVDFPQQTHKDLKFLASTYSMTLRDLIIHITHQYIQKEHNLIEIRKEATYQRTKQEKGL